MSTSKTGSGSGSNPESNTPVTEATQDSLLRQVNSSYMRIEQFVEAVAEVPGLGEALVDRANSTEFALRHQVFRVEHAIAVLGVRRAADTISKFADASRRQSAGRPHFLDKAQKEAESQAGESQESESTEST